MMFSILPTPNKIIILSWPRHCETSGYVPYFKKKKPAELYYPVTMHFMSVLNIIRYGFGRGYKNVILRHKSHDTYR